MPSKCPQKNTMKVSVHEMFELGGFCTWLCLAVWYGIARWLGMQFYVKLKFMVFEMLRLEWPQNSPKGLP